MFAPGTSPTRLGSICNGDKSREGTASEEHGLDILRLDVEDLLQPEALLRKLGDCLWHR